MNIKKLIASVVIALGAWMSVGVVQADTSFNFTATFGTPYSYNDFGTITGQVLVNSYNSVLSVSGLIESDSPVAVIGVEPSYIAVPGTSVPEFTGTGDFYIGFFYIGRYGETSVNLITSQPPSVYFSDTGYGLLGTATVSPSGGVAPEMNASFIPQVALILACLFFLFGRKKENTQATFAV